MYILDKSFKNLVKQDMNFLEFPLWVTNKKVKQSSFVIETKNGQYIFDANPNIGVPDSFDALLLYYFLFLSQNKNGENICFNNYEACKNLKLPRNTETYDRIEKSLNIWRGVSIKFEGCFYVGEQKHISMGFNIFNYTIKEKTGKNNNVIKRTTEIVFSEGFLKTIRESNFFKNIDLNLWIALKRPLARRLYEYLLKQFLNKNKFSSASDKLFPKIGLDIRKYPSDTEKQMKSIGVSVKKINEFDKNQTFSFKYYHKKGNIFIGEFWKENTATDEILIEGKIVETNNEITQKLRQFGFYRKSIPKLFKEHSVEVLKNAILDVEHLTERSLKTNQPILKIGAILRERLPESGQDYMFSDEYMQHQKEQEQIKLRKKKETEETEKEKLDDKRKKKEIELSKKVEDVFSKLSRSEQEEIDKEARELLKDKVGNIGFSILYKIKVKEIIREKYNIK